MFPCRKPNANIVIGVDFVRFLAMQWIIFGHVVGVILLGFFDLRITTDTSRRKPELQIGVSRNI